MPYQSKALLSISPSPSHTHTHTHSLFDLVRVSADKYKPAFYMALRNTLVAPDLEKAVKIAYEGTHAHTHTHTHTHVCIYIYARPIESPPPPRWMGS
jgi:chromosome segregation ATPase